MHGKVHYRILAIRYDSQPSSAQDFLFVINLNAHASEKSKRTKLNDKNSTRKSIIHEIVPSSRKLRIDSEIITLKSHIREAIAGDAGATANKAENPLLYFRGTGPF